ncbi:MAG: 3-phosphoshikimate 1-carboxyvinyltransferase [Pseudomonadota bacterium]
MVKEILPIKASEASVTIPGSKSYTHRALVVASLAHGESVIENPLFCDDTRYTATALEKLGAELDQSSARITVRGVNGIPNACPDTLQFGNSGTSIRFLTAISALGSGTYTLSGSARMSERPIQDLLDSLVQLGVRAYSIQGNGCPPLCIETRGVKGGDVSLKANVSSQYLSALLMIGPCTANGLDIRLKSDLVSQPYVTMTQEVMARFGASVEYKKHGDSGDQGRFIVQGGIGYRPGKVVIEPDASNASYFWGAAAISGSRIKVLGIDRRSGQGDIGVLELLAQMGCKVIHESDGIVVEGGALRGITVDMGMMPDMVPTVSVVAAFAQGKTVIRNVAHLKVKETDRLAAVKNELTSMGINVELLSDGLVIEGGKPHGAIIETYDDHRIAMAFAIAGLVVPGVRIKNPACVEKSFSGFWDTLEKLSEK